MRRATSSHASPIESVARVIIGTARSREQFGPERVEADASEVERALVEVLEGERVAGLLLRGVADLLPDALAHLVRWRLSRPSQVAVHLEADEGVVHVDVLAHERQRLVGVPDAVAVERRLLQVNAD